MICVCHEFIGLTAGGIIKAFFTDAEINFYTGKEAIEKSYMVIPQC